MSYIDDSVSTTMKFEGAIPWMYLDTKGNVTVGCGLELPNPAVACGLPFQGRTGTATEDAVVADFRRVHSMLPGRLPGYYHLDSAPVLAASAITALLRQRIVADDAVLGRALPGWTAYPDSVKQAFLDMQYNLGEGGLLKGYPHLLSHASHHAWAAAAAACYRNGISVERNEWTKNLFLHAVDAA